MILESILVLSSSWRTSNGTLGTPNVYCSSVVFPPLLLLSLLLLLLPLEISWYSSISLLSLLLDKDDFRHFEKTQGKPKDEMEKIPGSKRRRPKDTGRLLDRNGNMQVSLCPDPTCGPIPNLFNKQVFLLHQTRPVGPHGAYGPWPKITIPEIRTNPK